MDVQQFAGRAGLGKGFVRAELEAHVPVLFPGEGGKRIHDQHAPLEDGALVGMSDREAAQAAARGRDPCLPERRRSKPAAHLYPRQGGPP